MARIMTTNDGVYLAKAMKTLLNKWPKKPVAEIFLEDLGKSTPSMMLQQLSAAEKKKEYINGSYIGVWNFAVYIRINAEDTASRIDATGALQDLADWLQARDENGEFANLPDLDDTKTAIKFDMTSTPSISARYDDGVEDYQAILSLEYKAIRR